MLHTLSLDAKHIFPRTYGGESEFLDQADVVKDIVDGLRRQSAEPTQVLPEPEMDDLDLVITVGSQNAGGVIVPINPDLAIRSDIPKSIEDIAGKEAMLSATINAARAASGDNTSAKISIKTQDEAGGLQNCFEALHRLIALRNAESIMIEQGYLGTFEATKDGRISVWTSFESRDTATPWGPRKEPRSGFAKFEMIDKATRNQIENLAAIIVTGESRGVDKFAARVNVGSQLLAATAEIGSLINRNKARTPAERERIGIVTGFTVIDNATGESRGGEKRRPPRRLNHGEDLPRSAKRR